MDNIVAYVDERREDGQYVLKLLWKASVKFTVIPMSGVPEINIGLHRVVGIPDIERFLFNQPELPASPLHG